MLSGRHILLGISGGVAAFKAAYLARRLIDAGAEVRTIMTASATHFLGPQTLAAITGHAPQINLFDGESVSPHTDLAAWADAIVVAPATASTMSRIAAGLADDLLVATILAAKCPVVLAPAMHTEMWENPATQRNVAALIADGRNLVGPASGLLAGGDVGVGRMAEPEEIVDALHAILGASTLAGLRVLVSAGGTREPIDPVRYLGNRSSGKMGHAIAVEAASRGALVVLVTTAVPPMGVAGLRIVAVETAAEMADAGNATGTRGAIGAPSAGAADLTGTSTESSSIPYC